jgi:membrane-associated protease RseP (regulator of RpoE activity)
MPQSPAAEAGVKPGDIIWKINGREVQNVPETGQAIRLNLGETVTMRVKRGQDFLDLPVKARWTFSDIVHVVEPGEDVRSVAERLGLSVGTVRSAAGISSALEPGQQLTITEGAETITYTPEEDDTVASVAQQLGVSQQSVRAAASLPDPDRLDPGQELRFPQGPTGVVIAPQYVFTETQSYSLFKALPRGFRSTIDSLALARNEFISWIKGGASPEFSGPVGIAQATGEVVEEAGWKVLIDFAALLSVNLAVINILPLPMLDGGRIVFVLLEILRGGRRVSPHKEALVHLVGLVALLTLVVVMSYFDIARIIQGDSIFR